MTKTVGEVFWFTGLPGAGKTTLASLFFAKLNLRHKVFLDGDNLREIFGGQAGFDSGSRLELARRYGRLCKMLSEQGVHVVCATVSMFDSVRDWNRQNIENYHEIYIKVPLAVLEQRDQKGLYSKAKSKDAVNIPGVDLPSEEPRNSDLVIVNDGRYRPEEIFSRDLAALLATAK